MSKNITYYCNVCEKAINENDPGYGFLPHDEESPCVFGHVKHYNIHLCVACIREIACVADILNEGGELP